jgi:hypothetical protein
MLLISLFATLGVGSIAHASEELDCAGPVAGLVADHGDHVPADSDNPMLHHHGGWHGHHIGTPASRIPTLAASLERELRVSAAFGAMTAIPRVTDLRPPIA